ncbi:hypothetical protein FGF04_25075 [Streptomyces apricus]|uniref:Uncharacterized protein n=1 Tax=Streptomyces apricus TaxID=1828112 RepID=A0A5B0ASK4_9ACTN|nr:hypothetical protein FGF04_25075 [Streptomyces apricus]
MHRGLAVAAVGAGPADPAVPPAPGPAPLGAGLLPILARGVVAVVGVLPVRVRERGRVRPARFGGGAAPRAGKGAVEVPVARVAVVHDAGRLNSAKVTVPGAAVKVLCRTARSAWPGEDRTDQGRTIRRLPSSSRRNRYVPYPLTPAPPRPYCLANISNV